MKAERAVPGTLRRALSEVRRKRGASVGITAFAMLLLVAIFADFFASPLPVYGTVRGHTYVLANVTRPRELQSMSHAELEAELARGFALRALVHWGPAETGTAVLRPPLASAGHVLGTDSDGRDVFSVLVHGARVVVSFALLCVALLVAFGALVGALGGFFGGVFDAIVARSVETMTAFPTIVLVLAFQAMMPKASTLTLLLAISLTRWAEVARLVRGEVIAVSGQDYVLAARALGASPLRILVRYVFPNARAQALVSATFALATVILVEASCDFLGLGIEESSPTWGHLMAQSRHHPGAWWLLAFPALALLGTVVSQNVVGEALRDALDPRGDVLAERPVDEAPEQGTAARSP
ncbi:MAG: ABC transporter permease [Polyangiaceae bacterium]|nr:ABC transporter permease [Polyangiaceae bacterium]